jgi:hypothetical protein
VHLLEELSVLAHAQARQTVEQPEGRVDPWLAGRRHWVCSDGAGHRRVVAFMAAHRYPILAPGARYLSFDARARHLSLASGASYRWWHADGSRIGFPRPVWPGLVLHLASPLSGAAISPRDACIRLPERYRQQLSARRT